MCFNATLNSHNLNLSVHSLKYLVFLLRRRGTMAKGSSGVVNIITCPSGKKRKYLENTHTVQRQCERPRVYWEIML